MSGRLMTVYNHQETRQANFPDNRIAFLNSEAAVVADTVAMKKWANGEIGIDQLCTEVAWNNYLEKLFPHKRIPRKMMINELRVCGWLVDSQ